ncbi:hypothetical protein MEX01_49010 [Methylorubrum extorquens]|nr:hypothetical protein MEX01_49010 [Methylorubrum extorquens]
MVLTAVFDGHAWDVALPLKTVLGEAVHDVLTVHARPALHVGCPADGHSTCFEEQFHRSDSDRLTARGLPLDAHMRQGVGFAVLDKKVVLTFHDILVAQS